MSVGTASHIFVRLRLEDLDTTAICRRSNAVQSPTVSGCAETMAQQSTHPIQNSPPRFSAPGRRRRKPNLDSAFLVVLSSCTYDTHRCIREKVLAHRRTSMYGSTDTHGGPPCPASSSPSTSTTSSRRSTSTRRCSASSPPSGSPATRNFAIADPPLKLVLFEGAETGTINHLGVETESGDEVVAAEARLSDAGLETTGVDDTVCCYATKTETWLNGPDHALGVVREARRPDDGRGRRGRHHRVLRPRARRAPFGAAPAATGACC